MYCNRCGQLNQPGNAFCGRCGQQLLAPPPPSPGPHFQPGYGHGPLTAPPQRPPNAIQRIWRSGPLGKTVLLTVGLLFLCVCSLSGQGARSRRNATAQPISDRQGVGISLSDETKEKKTAGAPTQTRRAEPTAPATSEDLATVVPEEEEPSATPEDVATAAPEEEEPSATPETLTYTVLDTYSKFNGTAEWSNVLISPDMDDASLVRLAHQLHDDDPDVSYRFFTDDSEYEEFKAWDMNDGRVLDQDGELKYITDCIDMEWCADQSLTGKNPFPFPYPEEWLDQARIANVQQMYERGRMRWQLIYMDGRPSIDLE